MPDTPLGEVIERLESTISTPEARYVSVLRSDFNVILAALKAGREMVAEGIFDSIICCPFCDAVIPYHLDDCKWAALLAAYGKE